MGVIEKVTCHSCKQEWECRIGCGLLHGSLENVTGLFEEEVAAEIMEQNAEPFPMYDFTYQLGNCKKCYDVVSVPVLKMLKKEKVYIGACPVCGSVVDLIQEVEKASCIRCGKGTLYKETAGHWD